MQLEVQKYLFDIDQAARLLLQFVSGKTRDHYLGDSLLQRQFEVMGEDLGRLANSART